MEAPVRTALILAAGRGTRLRPLTHDIPKGLLPLGGEPILGRSIRLLRERGVDRIGVVTGHLAHRYEALAEVWGITCLHNPEYATTGSHRSAEVGAALVAGHPFLLLESDLVYHGSALDRLLHHPGTDVVLTSGPTHSGDEVWVEAHHGHLQALSKRREELGRAPVGELVGIWKLGGGALLETPGGPDEEYEQVLARRSRVRPIAIAHAEDLAWGEIDTEDHLRRVEREVWPKLQESRPDI